MIFYKILHFKFCILNFELKFRYYLFIAILGCFFTSCEIINPPEPIPSYIKIDKFVLTTDPATEGSNSSKITDAWIYLDDNYVGTFELPAKFPLIGEGRHTITVKAGIKLNGISATRSIYPFYKPYIITVNLQKDSVITLHPTITYYPETKFEWMENFEDGGVSLEKTIFSDTSLEKTSDPLKRFEGNYSGIVHLDSSRKLFECYTISAYQLPGGESPVIMEMNYKTNEEIYMGVISISSAQSIPVGIIHITKSDNWNKIYINIKNAILAYPDADEFKVFFRIDKSDQNNVSEIMFDNIKLLHFKNE